MFDNWLITNKDDRLVDNDEKSRGKSERLHNIYIYIKHSNFRALIIEHPNFDLKTRL